MIDNVSMNHYNVIMKGYDVIGSNFPYQGNSISNYPIQSWGSPSFPPPPFQKGAPGAREDNDLSPDHLIDRYRI